MPARELAIRLASYRPFEPLAPEHVASLGVRLVEFHLPRDDAEHEARQTALAQHGLRAASLQGRIDFGDPDLPRQFQPQLERMGAFDCQRMLLAFPPPDLPPAQVADRLRQAAQLASAAGVTLMLETHPNLFHNTATARSMLHAIDHPSARINYDPANVLFYNETRLDPVKELRELGDAVAGIHLKDTPGGFGERHFVELGSGVIDFPAIYQTLEQIGYEAPCTLEIEGIEGEERTEAVVKKRVEQSLEHLRSIGQL